MASPNTLRMRARFAAMFPDQPRWVVQHEMDAEGRRSGVTYDVGRNRAKRWARVDAWYARARAVRKDKEVIRLSRRAYRGERQRGLR